MNIVGLIFGHLFGDFVFQNQWMAMNKDKSNFKCIVHCLIYTACILLFTWNFSPYWGILVFLSHFFIDRFSLADKWLFLIRGRSLKEFFNHGHLNLPNEGYRSDWHVHNYHVLRGGFTTIVYCVVDNTFHFVLMYYGFMLLQYLKVV